MRLLRSVYEILLSCPPVPPESGGILGENNGIVCEVCLDPAKQSLTQAEYCPDAAYLNAVISGWEKADICFCGIFHTHLPEQTRLSSGDIEYINSVFQNLPASVEQLYFPVVLPGIGVLSYLASRKERSISICEDNIVIEKENLQ